MVRSPLWLARFVPEAVGPLELHLFGRTLGTAAIVGFFAGLVGAVLPLDARDRRILFIAGMAAGMAAVFRTPLGAALLAAEVLYRDDFESDAVVPSVIASVVGYATGEALLGQRALFGQLLPHPFQVGHLPCYAGLAVVAALGGASRVGSLAMVRRATEAARLPVWARPAFGGALLGLLAVLLHLGEVQRLLGISPASGAMGGGYGLAQLAVTSTESRVRMAGVLVAIAALRVLATSLTIGTGASAGDFAPSFVIGGLIGGAFGHACATAFPAAGISPGTFALVGMGALYGGVAHAPISAVVLVSELAGSFDLLMPLMLSTVGAHVALRRLGLYHARAPSKSSLFARVPRGTAAPAGP